MLPPPLKRHLLCLALALSAGPLVAQTSAATAPAATAGAGLRTTVEQDNLWDIAGQLAPAAGATRQQFMVAVLRRNPDAFVKGNIHRLRRGVPLVLPGRDEMLAEDRAASVALVAEHLKALKAGTVLAPLPPRPVPPVSTKVPEPPPVPVPASAPVTAPASAPAPVAPTASRPAAAPAPVSAPAPTSAPAPATVPPASAPEPASAPVPAVPASAVASEPVAPVTPAVNEVPREVGVAEPVGSAANRILPWLLMLGGVAGGVILWRRRRAGFAPDEVAPATGRAAAQPVRATPPRVFDISNAAADMARSVETAQVVTQLVRTGADAEASTEAGRADTVDRLNTQASLKLEIARASLEVGRPLEAKALLQAVLREGSGRQQAEAAEILGRMG